MPASGEGGVSRGGVERGGVASCRWQAGGRRLLLTLPRYTGETGRQTDRQDRQTILNNGKYLALTSEIKIN